MKTVEIIEWFLYNCGNFPEGKPFVKVVRSEKEVVYGTKG